MTKNRAVIPEAAAEPDDTGSFHDRWDQESGLDGWAMDRLLVETRHGPRPKLIIQTVDGEEIHAPCFRAGLRALIDRHDPMIGDAIAICHHGTDEGGKHRYSMRIARAG
jgi:hypothetical protein